MPDFTDPSTIGQFCFAILCAIGAIKSFSIVRRKDAEGFSHIGLGIILLVPLLVFFLSTQPPESAARMLLSAAMVLVVFAAFILSLIGVIRRCVNRGQTRRGLIAGIFGVGLSGLFLAAGGIGIYQSMNDQSDAGLVSGHRGERQRTFLLEEYNLRFSDPGREWRILRPEGDYKVHLMNSRPRIELIVIPEITGIENPLSEDALHAAIVANLHGAATVLTIGDREPVEVAGLTGQLFSTELRIGNKVRTQLNWSAVHNGIAVQVIGAAESANQKELTEAHSRFVQSLELIDPKHITSTTGRLLNQELVRDDFGFTFNSDGAFWIEHQDDPSGSPLLSAHTPDGTMLQIQRVDMPVADVPMDGIASGYLQQQGLEVDSLPILLRNDEVAADGTQVRDLVVRITSGNETFADHYRFLLRGNQCMVINAWNETSQAEQTGDPEKILDQVFVHSDWPIVQVEELGPAKQAGQALLINRLGLYHFSRNEFETALLYFERAHDIEESDVAYADNIVTALLRLEDYNQVLAQGAAFAEKFPDQPDFRASQAYALTQLGEVESALEVYATLFAGDADHDSGLWDYLELLMDTDQFDLALETIERISSSRPTKTLQLWHAYVLIEAEHWTEAEDLFTRIGEEYGWDSELFDEVIALYERSGDYQQALEWIERREQTFGPSFGVWYRRGIAQLELGAFRDAQKSFSHALELRPQDPDARDYLEYARGLLGQGSTQGLGVKLDPVKIPEAIASSAEQTKLSAWKPASHLSYK